jgi:hypothetical protein
MTIKYYKRSKIPKRLWNIPIFSAPRRSNNTKNRIFGIQIYHIEYLIWLRTIFITLTLEQESGTERDEFVIYFSRRQSFKCPQTAPQREKLSQQWNPIPIRVTRWVCEKIAQKCSPTYFLSKLLHNLNRGTSIPEMWATLVIKKTGQSN